VIFVQLMGKRDSSVSYSQVFTKLFVAVGLLFVFTSTQGATAAVPPEILAQLQNMSPAEQKALARQYGFDLDQVLGGSLREDTGDGRRPSLGAPGEPLAPTQRVDAKEAGTREDVSEDKKKYSGIPAKIWIESVRFGLKHFCAGR
jgi:hypothetical protein